MDLPDGARAGTSAVLRALEQLRPFFKRRVWALCGPAMLGAVVHLSGPAPQDADPKGLSQMLGRATGSVVDENQMVWENSAGMLGDLFSGRRVLFAAAPKQGAPKDIYRALVRVTPDGRPISVRQVRNITETPKGDDTGLLSNGHEVAFSTVAFGKIQSVTVLEPQKIRSEDRPPSLMHRAMLAISSWQEVGTLDGIGRSDVRLRVPAVRAEIKLSDEHLEIGITGNDEHLVYDLETRKLDHKGGSPGYAAKAQPRVHREKPVIFWAVDTVRAEVGPEPIAWLENQVFGAKDQLKQLGYRLFSASSPEAKLKAEDYAQPPELGTSKMAAETWPPPKIPSIWKETREGEGVWVPVSFPFLRKLPGTQPGAKVPPYFYKTFIRPDPKRPYSEMTLIAMDMRQLELRMQAGFEDPKPTTGPPGDGRLPTDPDVYKRVVATMNGAFKTTHGEYGMMVEKRVLIPPVKRAATIVVDDTGKTGLGSWPQTHAIPDDIQSYRQNLDPLVEDGKPNPTGRYIWGWQLQGQSVLTHRTAICVNAAGHLYYAFGTELDGPTLGKALQQAGCSYGVHLDMNPGHCGFVFTEVHDLPRGHFTLKLLDEQMKINPDRYVRWSAKDFLYLMIRDPRPEGDGDIAWEPDGGTQPEPSWLPGVFQGTTRAGSVEVDLLAIEPHRVNFRVRAGRNDPSPLGAPPKKLELSGDDTQRVLGAVGLGHTTDNTLYGLAFGKTVPLPLKSSYATLVLPEAGPPKLHPPGQAPVTEASEEAVQLPLLAIDNRLTPRARQRGALEERGALCVTKTGRVLIARATHDSSDLLVNTLLKLGCRDAVDLDRGSHHPPFVHRAGTSTPPIGGYETTTLYLLAGTMRTTAYRWKHEGSVPSTEPTGFDMSLDEWKEIEKRKREREAEGAAGDSE